MWPNQRKEEGKYDLFAPSMEGTPESHDKGYSKEWRIGTGLQSPTEDSPHYFVVRVSPKIARDCRSLNIKPVDASWLYYSPLSSGVSAVWQKEEWHWILAVCPAPPTSQDWTQWSSRWGGLMRNRRHICNMPLILEIFWQRGCSFQDQARRKDTVSFGTCRLLEQLYPTAICHYDTDTACGGKKL